MDPGGWRHGQPHSISCVSPVLAPPRSPYVSPGHSQGLAAPVRGATLLLLLFSCACITEPVGVFPLTGLDSEPASHYLCDLPAVCHVGSKAGVSE